MTQVRHAAGQHVPARPAFAAVGDGVDAHHGRARRDRAVAPDGCARKAQAALHRPGVGVLVHGHVVAVGLAGRVGRTQVHGLRGAAAAREGAAQHLVGELLTHVAPGRGLATPPGGQAGQGQRLAQQALGDAGQEALDGRCLEEGAAQRVGQHPRAGARGLQKARHAERPVGAQLQRVAPVVVEPAHHAVHGLQAFHRLEVEAFAAHGEVATLHQRQAEITRKVRVLEVGLAVGPGREQHHARVGVARHLGGTLLQRVEQQSVAAGDALHAQRREGLGELPRDDKPVVQNIAQAAGPLRALRHQPPTAVGAARQVEGGDEEALATRRRHADHGPQPARMAQQQGGWQQALVQQRLRAVEVGQHALQQLGALHHAGLDGGPVGGFDDQRQQLQRPGPRRDAAAARAALGEHVVRDAVEADALLHLRDAAVQVLGHRDATRGRRHLRHEALPGRAQCAALAAQLVPHAGLGRQRVRGEGVRRRARGRVAAVEGQRALFGREAGREGGRHRRFRACAGRALC